MSWLPGRKKRGSQADRQIGLSGLEEALGRSEAPADPYEHVRTAQGRTAHLKPSGAAPGVLCGWPGPWVPADPSLPVCRTCGDRAGGTAVAS